MIADYIMDWFNLLVRFLHLVSGIAWIGASFYFIWLDNNLEEPPEWKQKKGIKGDLWAVHGGGFYEVAKYRLAPEAMPKTLHWFKWEAYTTAITGLFLLAIMFYWGAETYLIDPQKLGLSTYTAISLGIGSIIIGWLVYEGLCRTPLVEHGLLFAVVITLLLLIVTWGLSETFSDRGAFMHVGAIIGVCMAMNVFTTIIPGQKVLVDAVSKGEIPPAKPGLLAKQRSVHNNYITLPILFIMMSNHYPMIYSHEYSYWLLTAFIVLGMWVRHFFNLRHHGIIKPSILISSLAGFAALAVIIAPSLPKNNTEIVQWQQIEPIINTHCQGCHSSTPTNNTFQIAPAGVILDTRQDVERWQQQIYARAVQAHDMPLGNMTKMTLAERELLGQWVINHQ